MKPASVPTKKSASADVLALARSRAPARCRCWCWRSRAMIATTTQQTNGSAIAQRQSTSDSHQPRQRDVSTTAISTVIGKIVAAEVERDQQHLDHRAQARRPGRRPPTAASGERAAAAAGSGGRGSARRASVRSVGHSSTPANRSVSRPSASSRSPERTAHEPVVLDAEQSLVAVAGRWRRTARRRRSGCDGPAARRILAAAKRARRSTVVIVVVVVAERQLVGPFDAERRRVARGDRGVDQLLQHRAATAE